MHVSQSRTIRRLASGMVSVGLLLAVFCATDRSASAQARSQANSNPGVLPPDSHPHGLTYGQWSARWWEWALEQPAALSPLADTTGANCAVGQSGSVWFLAGTFQMTEPVTRMCTIPPGKTLFFPIANAFYSAEGTFAEMQARAIADVNTATGLSVTVDGRALNSVNLYRALSPDFTLDLPLGNIFGVPPDAYKPSAADGYYIMLTPLTPGTHTIQIKAQFPASIVDVTYQITVSR
jgi:hypothetical protein